MTFRASLGGERAERLARMRNAPRSHSHLVFGRALLHAFSRALRFCPCWERRGGDVVKCKVQQVCESSRTSPSEDAATREEKGSSSRQKTS
eukprot:1499557-Pleurochrysis_carterae.AAC.1